MVALHQCFALSLLLSLLHFICNECIVCLQQRYSQHEKKYAEANMRLTEEYKRITEHFKDLQAKFSHFQQADLNKYQAVSPSTSSCCLQ